MKNIMRAGLTAGVLLSMSLSMAFTAASNPADGTPPTSKGDHHRYIVVAKSHDDYQSLRSDAERAGGKVVADLPDSNSVVVNGDAAFAAQAASNTHVQAVVPDQMRSLVRPNQSIDMFGASFQAHPTLQRNQPINLGGGFAKVTADPAFSLPGLMWDYDRIGASQAWKRTTGSGDVLVGVSDTGLDFTHSELSSKVVDVVDFTDTLCTDYFGAGDADFAAAYGGPANTDWNGHGSWIGGNIAGALDGVGTNGIAPGVKLVALKIAQWCGYAWDSAILDSFYYAADHGIDIVSISFGGYLDRTDPDQDATYKAYVDAVAYARSKGTVIVAAAGNEHLRIGDGGLVLSHGPLTIPGDPFQDYYGLWEVPGGVPGVVDVSATGNFVARPSVSCAAGTFESSNATCKPLSDAHQPTGVGRRNQLTYYSNYGPRIDVAAPGGARKFNVPSADRGGTGGWPYTTADGTTAFEEFSITSNWALEIPCFFNLGPQFYQNECYSTIQGTSMATPHASAVLALIASSHPEARHNVRKLVQILKGTATDVEGNTTPPLSATDLSAGDRTGLLCPTGYCHLGGHAISDHDAYGAGLVNAAAAVFGGH